MKKLIRVLALICLQLLVAVAHAEHLEQDIVIEWLDLNPGEQLSKIDGKPFSYSIGVYMNGAFADPEVMLDYAGTSGSLYDIPLVKPSYSQSVTGDSHTTRPVHKIYELESGPLSYLAKQYFTQSVPLTLRIALFQNSRIFGSTALDSPSAEAASPSQIEIAIRDIPTRESPYEITLSGVELTNRQILGLTPEPYYPATVRLKIYRK